MTYDLQRFVDAQEHTYAGALAELRRGKKDDHWIWFIFPQIAGLGLSANSRAFAIATLDEARAYLAHPVLGGRVRECCEAILNVENRTALEIFIPVDAVKLRSSMTLFHRAAPDEPTFKAVLDRYYAGLPDPATDALLGAI